MALTITSPGVQINEIDLSLRSVPAAGTAVLITGFAPQGPSSEPLIVTTMSELESIYGTPTTPAERYFYYSAKEVLNSPSLLTTIRLPYGDGTGEGFAKAYSGLFYPLTLDESLDTPVWQVGEPAHLDLTNSQYSKMLEGDFEWSGLGGSGESGITLDSEGGILVAAGIVILNDLQTTINESAEGYYIGFVDNTSVAASSLNFDGISFMSTLSGNLFQDVDTNRLDFMLSATAEESTQGITSISEKLEKVGFIGFESSLFQDHISLGVFKVRRSTADGSLLAVGATETYLGSLDSNRKRVSPTGGVLANGFIEDIINNGSPTIKLLINPTVSEEYDWTTNSTSPTTKVLVNAEAKGLFPVGVYTPNSRFVSDTKITGNVPAKLEKALRLVENPETLIIDIVADGGLTSIYAATQSLGTDNFDDRVATSITQEYKQGWADVSTVLINFSENTRRDCFTILDAPRSALIVGRDKKVSDIESKTFSQDVYQPLKELVGSFETNYAAVYGNWIRINDVYSGRLMWAPFSAFAAAVYSKNDRVANPWSAPGGLTRGTFNAIDIAMNPNQKQRDRLYEISVNPVVFFTGDGYAIMGQKTLQTKPTAFDRINVRRLFLALERAVQRTVKYFVFEPNTDFTRTRIRNAITPIFEFAKNTEGLFDYQIVVDERNNTPEMVDNNQLVVDIYIKPVRTAEFILVNFIATRTNQDFQELI